MNASSVYRSLFAIANITLISWSTPLFSRDASEVNEDEFWRTTYCVAGGLPMEIRFALADNPTKLEGDSFDLSKIDIIGKQIDIKISALLKESLAAALRQTYGNKEIEWSSDQVKELADSFILEIYKKAPNSLGIDFCGPREKVGNAALAAILGYFSRAVQLEDGSQPIWLENAQASSNGTIVIMLSMALRISQIDFDKEKVLQAFSERQIEESRIERQ